MKVIPVRTQQDEVDAAIREVETAMRTAADLRAHLESVRLHTDTAEQQSHLRGARRVAAIVAASIEQASTHVRRAQDLAQSGSSVS